MRGCVDREETNCRGLQDSRAGTGHCFANLVALAEHVRYVILNRSFRVVECSGDIDYYPQYRIYAETQMALENFTLSNILQICRVLLPVAFVSLGLIAPSLDAAAQNVSKYNDDPFVKPGFITPLTLPDSWPTNTPRNPHDLSPADTKTRLVTLGTGMPSPNPYRAGPSFALLVNDTPYLVDAGVGIWRSIARAALINGDGITTAFAPQKLKYLFLTHLHQDHTVGIPSLLLSPFNWIYRIQQEIYGPAGTEDMVGHILAAWSIDLEAAIADGNDPAGGRATAHDILFEESGLVYEDDNVTVEAYRTKHASLQDSFAYRFTTEDRVIVFTGDGGPYHPNIVRAARNADILVTETVTEENIRYAPWGGDTVEEKKAEIFRFHFSPAVLARIANEANVKAIVLAHEQNYNSGENYQPLGLINEVIAAGFEGEIYSAMDADVY